MFKQTNVKVYVRNNIIQVSGTVDKKQHRKSTGLEATKRNIDYVTKNAFQVLSSIINVKKENTDYNFVDYCEYSLEFTSSDRDYSQHRDYLSLIEAHIKPYFKNYTIKEVKTDTIELFILHFKKKINPKTKEPYSSSLLKKCIYIIKQAFKRASANDIIDKDYSLYIPKIQVTYNETEVYTTDEIFTILNNSDGWFNIFLHLLFCSGMRVGEVLPVKKGDFDFNYNTLYLQRSITKSKIKYSSSTKNHKRLIILPTYLIEILKEYTQNINDDDYIFTSKYGTCFKDSSAITKKYFKPLVEKLDNVKYKTLEAFRHTSATILNNNGISYEFIQEQLGHTKGSNVTKDHYIQSSVSEYKINEINRVFQERLQLRKSA